MFGVAHPDVPVNVTWTINDCCSSAFTDITDTINGSSYDFGPRTSGQIMPQQLLQVNEKQIARLFGLTLGGLLTGDRAKRNGALSTTLPLETGASSGWTIAASSAASCTCSRPQLFLAP
jgi:hypothetical protein